MTFELHPVRATSLQKDDECSDINNEKLAPETNHQPRIAKDDPILCPHCLRTASNGIKCKGICVAESDY
ncbi:hypothetical protein [Chamaesiphon sp.]|uniref:hypothetical protein n=1 Tax=Chamaesiphon sp. TaxID=2814140 RepID=UPI003593F87B